MVRFQSLRSSHGDLNTNLGGRQILAFLSLLFVLGESHEIVHTAVGRLLCGGWGPRDFNHWELAGNCTETEPLWFLATFIGPIFTFGHMWVGYYLLGPGSSIKRKSVGFCLVFTGLPFARILTAAMKGGDEVYGLQEVFANGGESTLLWLVGLTLVIALSVPPLYRAFGVLSSERRWQVFTGFFMLPFVVYLLAVLGVMNTLLRQGLLNQTGLIGSPLLVNLWTLFWVLLLAGTWRELDSILVSNSTGG